MSIIKKKKEEEEKNLICCWPNCIWQLQPVSQSRGSLCCALGCNVCLVCLAGPAARPYPDEDSDQQVVWGGSAGALRLWGWWWWSRTSVTGLFWSRTGTTGRLGRILGFMKPDTLFLILFIFIIVYHWNVAPVCLCIVANFYMWKSIKMSTSGDLLAQVIKHVIKRASD